jgi:two-component system nitrate/nitrite response regulator NarL
MSSKMKILVADDHDLLRETLVMFLESAGGFKADSTADFNGVADLIKSGNRYDVILLDLNMPGMAGLDGLTRAAELAPSSRIALISGMANRETAEKALEMGAAGFLPKTLSAKSLVNAIKFMAMGEQYAPIDFMTAEEDHAQNPIAEKLTERELQVLKGLTQGKSNKEIARDLDLQEPTVKLHMKTLYRKLGASNRTQAALIAKESGIF